MPSCKIQKKQEESKTFHKVHVIETNDDFLDKVCEEGSESWWAGWQERGRREIEMPATFTTADVYSSPYAICCRMIQPNK